MKSLGIFSLFLMWLLFWIGIRSAHSAETTIPPDAAAARADDHGLVLFYRSERAKRSIDVTVDGSHVTRLQPGQTVNFLPASGPFLLDIAVRSPGRTSFQPRLKIQKERPSQAMVIDFDGSRIRLTEQRLHALPRHYDKVFAFDGEDERWIDVSPPPDTALRRSGEPLSGSIQWVAPKSWPVRVLFILGHGLYEFDDQGNVILRDGQQPNAPVSIKAELYNHKPIWSNGVVYELVSSGKPLTTKVDSGRTFVLTKRGAVCPVTPIADAYRLLHEIRSPIYSGDCDKAVRWGRSGTPLRAYPSDINTSGYPALLWAVQYFRDPVQPLYDLEGKCVYSCAVSHQP
ncbi:hypothetical protein [Cupriavidus cauae]|uniref:Uncharacterized protein n=1 Tax=Cupriavidus cauae TaxID=2608999 RepID=A0A5M8AUA9_9BURK|nr:hypothetical protein [Cupriavidus cauae]KAA6125210.1 hypothetical protein F1599_10445 [Cupriavidus cauae]